MDGYFFDKRKMKKYFKKYGLIALLLFPILIALHVAFSPFVKTRIGLVLLLALFAGVLLGVVEFVLYKISQAKQRKASADVVVIKAGALGKKQKKYAKTTSEQDRGATQEAVVGEGAENAKPTHKADGAGGVKNSNRAQKQNAAKKKNIKLKNRATKTGG